MANPADRIQDKKEFFQRNYVKALEIISPDLYIQEDIGLSGTTLNPISDLINSNIVVAADLSAVGISVSATPNFPKINSLSGISQYFIKQNNLTEIDPFFFEKDILKPLGVSWKSFSTSSAFNDYVSGTLLPKIQLGDPQLAVNTASAFSDTASGTHEYLIDTLSWFYFLNTSANGGLAFDPSSYVRSKFLDSLYKGNSLTINDGINGLTEYLWRNYTTCTTFESIGVIPTNFVSSVDSSTTWTSGVQQLTKLKNLVDIVYSPTTFNVQDELVKDSFENYLNASLFLDDQESNGPFFKFLQAVGFSLADSAEEADKLSLIYDIERTDKEHLPLVAELLGWKFFGHDPSRWRLQLRNAVSIYKKKGTRQAIQFVADSVFSKNTFSIENEVLELWESYLPHLIYYSLATESPFFESLDVFTPGLAAGLGNDVYSTSSLDENLRITVDNILLTLAQDFPDNFVLGKEPMPVGDADFTFNYRGRDFGIPPFEEYRYYQNCHLIRAETDSLILSRIVDLLSGFGIEQTYLDSLISYIKSNTTKATEDIGVGNGWLFFTSGVQYPPNYNDIIANIGNQQFKSRADYLSLWSGKSSHVKILFKASDFDFANAVTITAGGAQGLFQASRIIKEFLPAHAIPEIGLYTSGSEDYVTKETRGAELFFDEENSFVSAGPVVNPNMLWYTESFDLSGDSSGWGWDTLAYNGYLSGLNVSANALPAPLANYNSSADLVEDRNASYNMGIFQLMPDGHSVIPPQGTNNQTPKPYIDPDIKDGENLVFSVYIKNLDASATDLAVGYKNAGAGTKTVLKLRWFDTDGGTNVVGGAYAGGEMKMKGPGHHTASISENLGGGWYRVQLAVTYMANDPGTFWSGWVDPNYNNGVNIWPAEWVGGDHQGESVGAIYLWGAQLEKGTVATAYRGVAANEKEVFENYIDPSGNRVYGSVFARAAARAAAMRTGPGALSFKKEDVDSVVDSYVSGLGGSSVQLPRNAFRRRDYKNLLNLEGYYDRTGFNMPIPLDYALSGNTSSFIPLGYNFSAGAYQTADVKDLHSVWDRCLTSDSASSIFGVDVSNAFPCRGASSIGANLKYQDQAWTTSDTRHYNWRGMLPPIMRAMHNIDEAHKYLRGVDIAYRNSDQFSSSSAWMNMAQSLANSGTEDGTFGPNSMDHWYGFRFGRNLHQLYKDYTSLFSKPFLREDLITSDGGFDFFSHLYGPHLYNGKFTVKGRLTETHPNLVASSFDASDIFTINNNMGSGILSLSGVSGGPGDASSYTACCVMQLATPVDGQEFAYSNIRNEFRNAHILSGIEFVTTDMLGEFEEADFFQIFNLPSSKSKTNLDNVCVNNPKIKMRAVEGFPRLRFDMNRYTPNATITETQKKNRFLTDHDFELSVRAMVGEDSGTTIGGASMGAYIHTNPIGNDTEMFVWTPEGKWEMVRADKLHRDEIIDKYTHRLDFPVEGMGSTTKDPVTGNFTMDNIKDSHFQTLMVPFNTRNALTHVPFEYEGSDRAPNLLTTVESKNGLGTTPEAEDFTTWGAYSGGQVSANAIAPPFAIYDYSGAFIWDGDSDAGTNGNIQLYHIDVSSFLDQNIESPTRVYIFSVFLKQGPGGEVEEFVNGNGNVDFTASAASSTLIKVQQMDNTAGMSIGVRIDWTADPVEVTSVNVANDTGVLADRTGWSLSSVGNGWYRLAAAMEYSVHQDPGHEDINMDLLCVIWPSSHYGSNVGTSGGCYAWGPKLEVRRRSEQDWFKSDTDPPFFTEDLTGQIYPEPYHSKESIVHHNNQEYVVEVFMIPDSLNHDKYLLLDEVSVIDKTQEEKTKIVLEDVNKNLQDVYADENEEIFVPPAQLSDIFMFFNKVMQGHASRNIGVTEPTYYSKGGSRINYRENPNW